ncbi:MAG: major facilitator transporter [Massilibacillus sp.]|nr:major facilitator transporter [Massilibacillus sp.]
MTTFILTLSALMVISSMYVLIPLINQLSMVFQASTYLTASVNSVFSLFYAIGFLFFGPLSERYGKKRVIVFGMFSLAIVTCIAGFSNSIECLIVCRAFQGFVAASFAPAAFAYVFDCFPSEKRMVAMTWITTGFLAAGIIGQIMSSLLIQIFSWQYIFWIFALFYSVLSLMNQQELSSNAVVRQADGEGTVRIVRRLVQNPSLLKAYIIGFTLLLSYVALYSSIGNYLSSVLKFSSHEIFNIRAIGIIGMLGSLLVRPLTQKYHFSKIVALGISIMMISVIIPIIMTTKGAIIFSLVCFVAGIAITIPCLISLIGQLAGNDSGLAVTGYTFITFVGASVGPLVANVGEFKLVAILLVSILCIALGSILNIRKTELQ